MQQQQHAKQAQQHTQQQQQQQQQRQQQQQQQQLQMRQVQEQQQQQEKSRRLLEERDEDKRQMDHPSSIREWKRRRLEARNEAVESRPLCDMQRHPAPALSYTAATALRSAAAATLRERVQQPRESVQALPCAHCDGAAQSFEVGDRGALLCGLQAKITFLLQAEKSEAPNQPCRPSLPPEAPSSTASGTTAPHLPHLRTLTLDETNQCHWDRDKGQAQARSEADTEANHVPKKWGLVLARSAHSPTGFEGVYVSMGGFGAEINLGAKRLRQDGFRSPFEAALERARWAKSLEEGREHPGPNGTGAVSNATSVGNSVVCGSGRSEEWFAQRAAAPPQLTSKQAQQQAQAEGLTLRVADSKTGYVGVALSNPGKSKPYQARVWHGGKDVHLGYYATAEEAALCVARSPEGQVAAERAAAAALNATVTDKAADSSPRPSTTAAFEEVADWIHENGAPGDLEVKHLRGKRRPPPCASPSHSSPPAPVPAGSVRPQGEAAEARYRARCRADGAELLQRTVGHRWLVERCPVGR